MGNLAVLLAALIMAAYIWKFIIKSPGYLIGNAVLGVLIVLPICILIGAAGLDAQRHSTQWAFVDNGQDQPVIEAPVMRTGKPIQW